MKHGQSTKQLFPSELRPTGFQSKKSMKTWYFIKSMNGNKSYSSKATITTSLVAAREKVDIRQAYSSTSIYCLIAIIEHCLAPNSKRTCKSMRQLSTFSDQLLLTTTLLADYIFAVFELVSYRYLVGNCIFKWYDSRGELSN